MTCFDQKRCRFDQTIPKKKNRSDDLSSSASFFLEKAVRVATF